MAPPCCDADQMRFEIVARPPNDVRRMAGEFDDVLAGSAADLEHVSALVLQERGEDRPDRAAIAVERGRVEPPVSGQRGARCEIPHELRHALRTTPVGAEPATA